FSRDWSSDVCSSDLAVASLGERADRFHAERVDAGDRAQVAALLREHDCDVLLNATDPRFVMPLFRAALGARATYVDMAMSLSRPDRESVVRGVASCR